MVDHQRAAMIRDVWRGCRESAKPILYRHGRVAVDITDRVAPSFMEVPPEPPPLPVKVATLEFVCLTRQVQAGVWAFLIECEGVPVEHWVDPEHA